MCHEVVVAYCEGVPRECSPVQELRVVSKRCPGDCRFRWSAPLLAVGAIALRVARVLTCFSSAACELVRACERACVLGCCTLQCMLEQAQPFL